MNTYINFEVHPSLQYWNTLLWIPEFLTLLLDDWRRDGNRFVSHYLGRGEFLMFSPKYEVDTACHILAAYVMWPWHLTSESGSSNWSIMMKFVCLCNTKICGHKAFILWRQCLATSVAMATIFCLTSWGGPGLSVGSWCDCLVLRVGIF